MMTKVSELYPDLSWEVEPLGKGAEQAFIVDLGRLAFGLGHRTPLVRLRMSTQVSSIAGLSFPANKLLTLGLAPSIQEWSVACSMRTVRECLYSIKWFYRFVHEAAATLGIIKHPDSFDSADEYISSLDRAIGVSYAGWLQKTPCADATRAGRYAITKIFIENATGNLTWRSNPFEYNPALLSDDSSDGNAATPEQVGELVAACKEIVRSYKRVRSGLIRGSRADPFIKACRGKLLESLPDLSESLIGDGSEVAGQFFPNVDIACACFFLAIVQLGCNEQPIRDLQTRGAWWRKNPFSEAYRLICLEKNRSGGRVKRYMLAAPPGPKSIKISVKASPQYQPFKILRYYGLLSSPLRSSCLEASVGEANANERDRAITLAKNFWTFIGTRGKVRGFSGNNLHGLMNDFFCRLAQRLPVLLNSDGSAIRFRAKELRDAYFEFTMKRTAFDTPSGQAELSHSADSGAIRNYMNRVWAKKYSRDQYRDFQTKAFSVLRDPDTNLSPAALKSRLDGRAGECSDLGGVISVPPKYRPNQVRHGYFCKDPSQPPTEVYISEAQDDVCPAEECWHCSSARCYDESLPELALDIFVMKRERDECAPHLWSGSEAEVRLFSLEEVFSRWPESKRKAALEEAGRLDKPYEE